MESFYEAFRNSRNLYLYIVLRLLNTKYVLHEQDVRYDFFAPLIENSPEIIKSKLDRQMNIIFVKNFGKWFFYKIDDNLPHFYLSEKISLIKWPLEALILLTRTDMLDNMYLDLAISSQVIEHVFDEEEFIKRYTGYCLMVGCFISPPFLKNGMAGISTAEEASGF